jgi:protein-L-isoaspartate(D-aspartate) O-methyltransferase
MPRSTDLEKAKSFYAKLMATASRSNDPRLQRAFERVPREDFMPPGPWKIMVDHYYVETPDADPVYLYQNALVALDADRGINNGEPYLHAAWMGAVAPQPGEIVCHIGAGTGYYTAILSILVQPDGNVEALEIEPDLARQARQNLASYENVAVTNGDATKISIPECDLIYVNAGVTSPPVSWLEALRLDGRMIFPWRPSEAIGLTLLVRRFQSGFSARPLMGAWFIPCIGASSMDDCRKTPDRHEAHMVASAWLTAEREPDDTAVAIYRDIWFSSASLPD